MTRTTLKTFKQQLQAKLKKQLNIEHEALAKAKESMWEFGNVASCSGSEDIGFREGRIRLLESLSTIIKEGRLQ